MVLPIITVEGNLTHDPEYAQRGDKLVAIIRLASNQSRFNPQTPSYEQTGVTYLRATAWPPLSEHIERSQVAKGDAVIAVGRLETKQWQSSSGEPRSALELTLHNIGFSMRSADSSCLRQRDAVNHDSSFGSYSDFGGSQSSSAAKDPWDSSSEPEF